MLSDLTSQQIRRNQIVRDHSRLQDRRLATVRIHRVRDSRSVRAGVQEDGQRADR